MFNTGKFVALVMILYFVLRTHGIVQVLPGFWVIPFAFIILYSFHSILKSNLKSTQFLIKQSKWIIVSVLILIVYKYFKYGNFKLHSTFDYLLTSIPFYIVGYYNGVKLNKLIIKNLSIFYFVFLFIFLLPKIFLVITTGAIFNNLFVDDINDKGFLLFLPFVSFATIFGFLQIIKSKFYLIRVLGTIMLIFNLLALFLSGKAGPIVVILFALIFYFLKKDKLVLRRYRNVIFSTLGVFLFLFLVSSGLFGDLGSLQRKSSAFINIVDSDFLLNDQVLNQLTSDRWTLSSYSVEQFFKKPLFGHGAYLESVGEMLGESQELTTAAGGHSFIFDTLAFFGILGLPLIMILYKFMKDGIKYYELVKNNQEERKVSLIYASLLVGIFIANFLNSGFLFSSFDNYLFLLSGFYLGKFYRIKKQLFNKNSLRIRPF